MSVSTDVGTSQSVTPSPMHKGTQNYSTGSNTITIIYLIM